MYFKILGSAAGGGLPQWNCYCANCLLARQRSSLVLSRTQCCAAISADRRHWFLLNASPDIRSQVLELPPPQTDSPRRSPFEAILLNDADLDHVLGLFVLREGGRLNVHCTPAVREQLTHGLELERTLQHYCELVWHAAPSEDRPLLHADGAPTGLLIRALDLGGSGPRYACEAGRGAGSHVAWVITDAASGRTLVHAPSVAAITEPLLHALNATDAVTFDGTFYRDDELAGAHPGAATARQMGHIPIEENLPQLAALDGTVIFTHINNTNPIVRHDSLERATVLRRGFEVAYDGMEFEI